jgi:hypothetical protein
MDKRDFILSRYPDAVLVEVPPISHATDSVLLQPGYWVVYAGRDLSAVELGRGETGARAWANAATKLQRERDHTEVAPDPEADGFAQGASHTAGVESKPRRREH